MTVGATLALARSRLSEAGIEDAGLEAEVLLQHALGLSREQLLASLGEPVDKAAACRFDDLLGRRLRREPAAYITGHREFFGLEFEVTPATLIPRPETELLVETAIELAKPRGRIRRGPVMADIGAGCGAIAVALAVHVARSDVYAVDLSHEALEVAARNAERHGMAGRVHLYRGDLLSPLPEYLDVIVANLPYVPSGDIAGLAPEVRDHEPRPALDGGPDGLDVIRAFLRQAPLFLRPRGCVCLEFGFGQADAVTDIARRHFPEHALEVRQDLAGIDRVLLITPEDS